MTIYIWLLISNVIVFCNSTGCSSTSMAHFDYLIGIGALELIFELSGVIKIFTKKNGDNNGTHQKN